MDELNPIRMILFWRSKNIKAVSITMVLPTSLYLLIQDKRNGFIKYYLILKVLESGESSFVVSIQLIYIRQCS